MFVCPNEQGSSFLNKNLKKNANQFKKPVKLSRQLRMLSMPYIEGLYLVVEDRAVWVFLLDFLLHNSLHSRVL